VLAVHEQARRNNRDKHEADRFPHFVLSLLGSATAQSDENAARLERVYLKEHFARRAVPASAPPRPPPPPRPLPVFVRARVPGAPPPSPPPPPPPPPPRRGRL